MPSTKTPDQSVNMVGMRMTVHELYYSFEIKPIRSMTLLFLFAQITAFFKFIYSKSEDTSLAITKKIELYTIILRGGRLDSVNK